MQIAVVDDEQEMRTQLAAYIRRFSEETKQTFTVSQFPSADALLTDYCSEFDIIIFDIDMPGLNGMDAARKIRETDSHVTILFVTNMAQYAINGYEVEAVDYIIKPIGYYDFSMKFQKALRRVSVRQDEHIVVESPEGPVRLSAGELQYVEIMGHYLVYHTAQRSVRVRGSMKDSEELLGRLRFCRCHKSYLVNLKHIVNLRPGEVLVGEKSIPLGRAYKDTLMAEYMRYLRG